MSKKVLFLGIFSLFFLSSCHYISKKSCCAKKAWKKCCGKSSAVGHALISSVTEEQITGEVFFQQMEKYKVKVTASLTGLKPNQKFGFHVHEFGNCENKALMAGAHFNPWKKKHGAPIDQEKHLGDLGNLESDAKGQAAYSTVLSGKARKFFGRSVIVHALPDDLKSQPTGQSGDRIACGVIVAAMPPAPEVKETKEEEQKKAVPSSAVKTQPEVKKAATKPAAKPGVKKAATKPAVKPGVKKAATKPAVKPGVKKAATKPAAKPEVKKAATKPAAKPGVKKAATKPAAKPGVKKAATKPAAKPGVKKASIKSPAKPEAQKASNQKTQ